MHRRLVSWTVLGSLLVAVSCGGREPDPPVGPGPVAPPPESDSTDPPDVAPPPVPAGVLLRDDFNGTSLNGTLWFMLEGAGTFLGRTQLRPSWQPLQVSGGVLRLQLDTYNPTARVAGDSFWGAEVVTHQNFPVGTGLGFSARVRLDGVLPGGMVASVFGYALNGAVRDEIDFELLTNDRSRVLTNVFQADGFSTAGRPQFAGGIDAASFNEFAVEWYPNRIRWKVNGQVVREVVERVPVTPMTIRLNLWAPAADFPAGFNAALQPSATAAGNQVYFYDVDWVEVRRLP